jgi:hypothetical protein
MSGVWFWGGLGRLRWWFSFGGSDGGLAGSELEIRLGVQYPGHCSRVQRQLRLLVPLKDAKVGIGASQLGRELRLSCARVRVCQAIFSGAQAHERKLVIFATLDLQVAPVGAIGDDRVADIGNREGTPEPCRIRSGKSHHNLTEEALQIHAAFSCC